MRYISVFSGIESASVAWHSLNWNPVAFADIDEFPSSVLEYHYPTVPNVGDVVNVDWEQWRGKADLVVGGSPCQSFSVAGKRLGMDDPRGNLALHYLRIVRSVQPKWFVYENVPGLLSSNEGEDFATFLGEVAKCGYGFAYRVLDAQYFGVPQRRRRLFVVGCADGDWRSAASILFDSKSLCGDSAKGRSKGEKTTLFTKNGFGGQSERVTGRGIRDGEPSGALTAGMYHHASINNQCLNTNGHLIMEDKGIVHCENVAPTMSASGPPYSRTGQESIEDQALVVQKAIPIHDKATRYKGGGDSRKNDGAGNGLGVGDEDSPMFTLTTADHHMVYQQGVDLFNQELTGDVHCPLRTAGGHGAPAAIQNQIVRRLTPIECERLQGFPDNYTQIPWKGKDKENCPDSHRYKALGNSMAVPVMRWIGERIDMLDSADISNRGKAKSTKQMTLW